MASLSDQESGKDYGTAVYFGFQPGNPSETDLDLEIVDHPTQTGISLLVVNFTSEYMKNHIFELWGKI